MLVLRLLFFLYFHINHNHQYLQNFEDEKLSAFELASLKITNYPDEFITYAKFLDDNDP